MTHPYCVARWPTNYMLDFASHVVLPVILKTHDVNAVPRPTSVYVQAVFFIEDEPLVIHALWTKTALDLLDFSR